MPAPRVSPSSIRYQDPGFQNLFSGTQKNILNLQDRELARQADARATEKLASDQAMNRDLMLTRGLQRENLQSQMDRRAAEDYAAGLNVDPNAFTRQGVNVDTSRPMTDEEVKALAEDRKNQARLEFEKSGAMRGLLQEADKAVVPDKPTPLDGNKVFNEFIDKIGGDEYPGRTRLPEAPTTEQKSKIFSEAEATDDGTLLGSWKKQQVLNKAADRGILSEADRTRYTATNVKKEKETERTFEDIGNRINTAYQKAESDALKKITDKDLTVTGTKSVTKDIRKSRDDFSKAFDRQIEKATKGKDLSTAEKAAVGRMKKERMNLFDATATKAAEDARQFRLFQQKEGIKSAGEIAKKQKLSELGLLHKPDTKTGRIKQSDYAKALGTLKRIDETFYETDEDEAAKVEAEAIVDLYRKQR